MKAILVILLIVFVAACSSANSPVGEDEIPAPTPSEAIFPHKATWSSPEEHGEYVREQLDGNEASCLDCHGISDSAKGGPACNSCHENFPHAEGWKESHGQTVVTKGDAACAGRCHGTDFQGGLTQVACAQCHSLYPHPAGWSLPSSHGSFARGADKEKCADCHGSDWKGGRSKVSCLSCHKELFPHPKGWVDEGKHGDFVAENSAGKCASNCHGEKLDGGLSGVNCSSCHNLWPHPKNGGWVNLQHGPKARQFGIPVCMSCHKDNPAGGSTGVTCTQCHESLPSHTKEGWDAKGHGGYIANNGFKIVTECAKCHGSSLTGGIDPGIEGLKPVPGCNSCHTSYPLKHGEAGWKDFAGHGNFALDNGKTECKLCHGDDFTGGAAGKSCYTCHASYPHPVPANVGNFTPWLNNHGKYVSAKDPDKATCAKASCHGTDLQGNPANVPVQQKVVKGCGDCHLMAPHPKPGEKWDHGKSALTADGLLDTDKCVACHGDELKGKGNAPSCYSCHQTYPDLHRTTGWKTTVTGHGAYVLTDAGPGGSVKNEGTTDCKICHGNNLGGGAAGKSCYGCHESYPHAPPTSVQAKVGGVWTWLTFNDANWLQFDQGHGSYAAAEAQKAKVAITQQVTKECATGCHGTDLKTVVKGLTCFSCHKTFPHQMPQWMDAAAAASTNHGETVLNAAAKQGVSASQYSDTCTYSNCHGTGGKAWGTKVCNDCHAGFPDGHKAATWKNGGHAELAKTSVASCLVCHGVSTPGIVPGACASCHDPKDVYPHPDGWYKPYDQDKSGGSHGPSIMVQTSITNTDGCLTACHGKGGEGMFAPGCTSCHANYPHADSWYEPTGAGYATHGTAVLDMKGTETKDDDTFDATKFAECARCHGEVVLFDKDKPKLSPDEVSIKVKEGVSIYRCTACHRYPHQQIKAGNDVMDWGGTGGGHIVALLWWKGLQDGPTYAKWTCGGTNDMGPGGCHTDGPWKMSYKTGWAKAGCAFCHTAE